MFFKTFPAVRLSYATSMCALKDPVTLRPLISQGLPLSDVPMYYRNFISNSVTAEKPLQFHTNTVFCQEKY